MPKLNTKDYLIIELDTLGNAHFANYETTAGTINSNYLKRIIRDVNSIPWKYVWEIALSRNGNDCEFVTLCGCDAYGSMLNKEKYIIDIIDLWRL